VLLAIERDAIGILLGDHKGQEPRPGQALGDGLGRLIWRNGVTFAMRAGVGPTAVFHDEQRRRLVAELLAALDADLDPRLATTAGRSIQRRREAPWGACPC
jgi:hypothetical protein